MYIDFNSLDYTKAVTVALVAVSTNPGNIILIGGIFLSLATIRLAFIKKIDKIDNKLSLQEEKKTLSEQDHIKLKGLVEESYNNLQTGDNKLRNFG
jgi:hypothetical protein